MNSKLTTQETPSIFDYRVLSSEQATLAKNAAIEIKSRERSIWENIIAIGQKLLEVKHCLEHGQFINWIQNEFQWSDRYARNFMTIAEELAQGNYSSDITSLSTKALYQLAAGLADSDSEQKQALINRIEQQTEIKGEKLTEAEIKKIREEIQSEFRQKQQELNLDFQQKISMANYKIEVVESENNQLKTKLKKSLQFEQLYKDTYQEKKLFEQELKGKTQELESLKKQAKAGKANLEKERQLVSKIEELQSELTNKTTELQELSQQLAQDKSLLINWLTSSKSLHNKLQLISLSRKKLPEFDYSQLFNYLKQLTEILASLTYEQN